MKFWEMVTNVAETKRASRVFLSVTGKVREAVLEMDSNNLNDIESMTKLYIKFDGLFKVDANLAALRAYDELEKYSRVSEINMAYYQNEFDWLVQQLKEHKINFSDPVFHSKMQEKTENFKTDHLKQNFLTHANALRISFALSKIDWEIIITIN